MIIDYLKHIQKLCKNNNFFCLFIWICCSAPFLRYIIKVYIFMFILSFFKIIYIVYTKRLYPSTKYLDAIIVKYIIMQNKKKNMIFYVDILFLFFISYLIIFFTVFSLKSIQLSIVWYNINKYEWIVHKKINVFKNLAVVIKKDILIDSINLNFLKFFKIEIEIDPD